MRCVSVMSAKSMLLSWSTVVSSFLCKRSPLEFQRRMERGLMVWGIMVGGGTGCWSPFGGVQ